jgi:hypothetical protein
MAVICHNVAAVQDESPDIERELRTLEAELKRLEAEYHRFLLRSRA